MHAQPDAGVRAPSFNQCNQVPGDDNTLASEREDEFTGGHGTGIALAEFVELGKIHRLPEAGLGNGIQAFSHGDLHARNLDQARESESEPEIHGCLAPLGFLKGWVEGDTTLGYGPSQVGL